MRLTAKKQQYVVEGARLREIGLSLERRIRDTERLVEGLRYEAKMQHARFTCTEQDLNAAVFRTHELETRLTLLNAEHRSLNQKMGSAGMTDFALTKKFAEKSKEFDDLTARFEAMRTEFAMIKQDNTKFFAQVEQVDAE